MTGWGHYIFQTVTPPENVGAHFFWIALPVMMSTALGQFIIWLTSKRRGEKKDRERAELEAKKEERAAVLLENFPIHAHGEYKDENSKGPLRVENMRFPVRDKK